MPNVLCHYHDVPIAPPQPTVCHYFIRLLKEKGLLLRCYTQVGGRGRPWEEGWPGGPGASVPRPLARSASLTPSQPRFPLL